MIRYSTKHEQDDKPLGIGAKPFAGTTGRIRAFLAAIERPIAPIFPLCFRLDAGQFLPDLNCQ